MQEEARDGAARNARVERMRVVMMGCVAVERQTL